eukprot:scaffold56464_cov24-Cyclotella_meneghiniana.AAC.3
MEKPDSTFMSSGNQENRLRVLRGFKENPFTLQINGLPNEEVAAQWERQIEKNECLDGLPDGVSEGIADKLGLDGIILGLDDG